MGRGWESGDYVRRPLRELLDDVASAESVPAAGCAAAVTAALAAALVTKVARRSRSQRGDADELITRAEGLLDQLTPQVTGDAAAYAGALAQNSAEAMQAASAALVVVAEAGAQIAEIAADLATTGNPRLRYDAAAAERLAGAAAQVAASLIVANTGHAEHTPPGPGDRDHLRRTPTPEEGP